MSKITAFIIKCVALIYALILLFDLKYNFLDVQTRLLLVIFGYSLFLIGGVISFSQVIGKDEFNKKRYIESQIFILGGLTTLAYFADFFKIFSVDAFNFQNYFEMGSFSLAITGIIFGFLNNKDKRYEPRRVVLLTIVSALIFFFLGIGSTLSEQFSQNHAWFNYLKSSGFFLASYNLFSATVLLLQYFLNKWGDKI